MADRSLSGKRLEVQSFEHSLDRVPVTGWSGPLIIGLWKRTFPDSEVYITPRWHEMQAVWSAGADIVAIDATARARPDGELLADLVRRASEDLKAPVMADVDSVEAGVEAARLGCRFVGTTLFGYAAETAAASPPGWSLLEPLRQQLPAGVALISEGGIASAEMAVEARKLGADCVVVGTAITGVDLQVQRYCRQLAAG